MKRPKTSPSKRKRKTSPAKAAQRRASRTARRRGRRFDPTRPFREEPEGPPPEISYARVVLWGGRGGDIQFGSLDDYLQEHRRNTPSMLAILEAFERPFVEAMEAVRPAGEAIGRAFADAFTAIGALDES